MVAEDLVQETFLSALAGADRFEGRSSEKTWLVAILKHKIIDHFRKSGKEQPMDQPQNQENQMDHFFHENGSWKDKPEEWDTTPDRILHQKEFWNVFVHCLSELSDRLRIAFSLREMEGLGCDEICKILGVSSSNCWVMLYRARMLLRRCLGVNWFGGKDVSLDV
jgi:RNA polymerase sigma-70 factor (ECF subfamily)